MMVKDVTWLDERLKNRLINDLNITQLSTIQTQVMEQYDTHQGRDLNNFLTSSSSIKAFDILEVIEKLTIKTLGKRRFNLLR